MSYLRDSDWLIDFLSGRPNAVELVAALLPQRVAISAITYMEVLHGIRGGRARVIGEAALTQFLRSADLLDFTRVHAERAADTRLELRRQQRQVNERALDILIAATAIEHDLILVTRNTRDYEDIAGLRLYEATEDAS